MKGEYMKIMKISHMILLSTVLLAFGQVHASSEPSGPQCPDGGCPGLKALKACESKKVGDKCYMKKHKGQCTKDKEGRIGCVKKK